MQEFGVTDRKGFGRDRQKHQIQTGHFGLFSFRRQEQGDIIKQNKVF